MIWLQLQQENFHLKKMLKRLWAIGYMITKRCTVYQCARIVIKVTIFGDQRNASLELI